MNDIMIPPHNQESEQSIIGGLLLDSAAFDRIADQFGAEMFFLAAHRLIYQQIVDMLLDGRGVDVVTVAERMEANGTLDEAGGLAYLATLAQNTPSAANIVHYAAAVREKWQSRQIMALGMDIIDQAQRAAAGEVLDHAMASLASLAETRTRKEAERIGVTLKPLLTRIDEAFASDGSISGLPTGLTDLDERLGGLRPGQLIVVAGRPSMGKTAFAMGIAHHAAGLGTSSLVLSMEMPAIELAAREVAMVAKLSVSSMLRGKLVDDDWAALTHGIGVVNELPIYIDEQGNLSLSELAAKVRTARRKHGIGLVVIDYLQLMRGSGEENRNHELSSITRGLKALAKSIGVPVIALSQLSRDVEKRTNKRPMASDLRDSGSIEQDADVILFIYRDEIYNPDSQDTGIAEIIIGKQRNGPVGIVRTVFDKQSTAFRDWAGVQASTPAPAKPKYRGMD